MTTDRIYYSDLAIPPGEYLAEVLEEKGIYQADLARRMGRPIPAINEIIKGDKTITSETALQLEQVLGVPAHIWTGLEAHYQLVKARANEQAQLENDIPLLEQIPFVKLVRLGFVKKTRIAFEKVKELQRFFGVSALSNMPQVKAFAPAFRCSGKHKASPYALAAWLRCGEIKAREIETKPFSREKLEAVLAKAKKMTSQSPEVFLPNLKRMLAEAGVALVILQHLPKTYAHGATFWLGSDKAVVLMSIRGSWADMFWFSLIHELAHVLKHDKRLTFIDDGVSNPDVKKQEDEANAFAGEQLIPSTAYAALIQSAQLGSETIRAFAKGLGVHPGIVVGRLQHDKKLPVVTVLNRMRERYVWKESAT